MRESDPARPERAPLFVEEGFSFEDLIWGSSSEQRRRRLQALRRYVFVAPEVIGLLNAQDREGWAIIRLRRGEAKRRSWHEVLRGLIDRLGASPSLEWVVKDPEANIVMGDTNLLERPESSIARVLLALGGELRRALLAFLMLRRPRHVRKHGLRERLDNRQLQLTLQDIEQKKEDILKDERIEKLEKSKRQPKADLAALQFAWTFLLPLRGLPLDKMLWCHLLNFVQVLEWSAVLRVCPGCGLLHAQPGQRGTRSSLLSRWYCSTSCSNAARQRRRRQGRR